MKICVATGTRAEYGLLKPLLDKIHSDDSFELQLLVTAAHLSPEFGLTFTQIENDGFTIDSKVEMLLSSDTAQGIVKSMGLGMIGYADAFNNLKPDLLIILGDRYEMLAIASAALIYKVPIAHLHGGEITEGAYDDAIRHAISKLSNLHFTSTNEYRNRVIQLGEQPKFVFNVGAIGLDNISEMNLLNQQELADTLGLKFCKYNYLITFHPETLNDKSVADQFQILLDVIEKQENSFFIFTKANADTDGRVINRMIDDFVGRNSDHTAAFNSMGQLRYLSAMQFATAVVGNSSSGIIEAPSFKVPTINIGDRQKGRIQARTVLNVEVSDLQISNAFDKVKDPKYLAKLLNVVNPYGQGDTANKILNHLRNIPVELLKNKIFYNFKHE